MRLIIISFILLFTIGCAGRRSDAWPVMDKAESFMEDAPDSALRLLTGIDEELLPKGEEQARHALLYSMALDKNCIDTTAFDVLQPAIDYYLENGTADEKMRTLYYQGRIFQNVGKQDQAMNAFVKAKDLAPMISDSLTLARLLVAQSLIFSSVFNSQRNLSNLISAKEIYEKLQRYDEEIDCLKRAFGEALVAENDSFADCLYEEFKEKEKKASSLHRLFYGDIISYKIEQKDTFALDGLIDYGFRMLCVLDSDEKIALARACNAIGSSTASLSILEELNQNGDFSSNEQFLATYVKTLRNEGQYEKAFNVLWRLDCISQAEIYDVFQNDLIYSERLHQEELEKHKLNDRYARTRYIFVLIIVGFGLLSVITLLLYKRQVQAKSLLEKENEILNHNLLEIEAEKEKLSEIISNKNELSNESRKIILKRLDLLNAILVDRIKQSGEIKSSERDLIKNVIADKERFIKENTEAIIASHPKFIEYLYDYGLTEEEIDYSCLYAIGMRGTHISSFLNSRTHYNISSDIRKKLGLERNETNLSLYIRELFNNQK